MAFSACIYAAFKDSWRLFADIFQTFLLLASLATLTVHWSFFKKEKLLWLLPIALVVQLSSWLYSLHSYPEIATDSPQLGRFLEFFIFFFIAFWLRGNEKYIWAMLTCFVFGSIFTLNYHSPLLEEISVGLSGKRVDFDYRNAQHGALIIGASTLTLTYFLTKLCRENLKKSTLFVASILVLLLLVLLQIVMQTRQALLGIAVALACSKIYNYHTKEKLKIKTIGFIFVAGVLLILIGLQFDIIYKRLQSELYVITDYILTGDFSNIPYTSIGIRVQLWFESAIWIIKSPLLGFGNGIEAFMIEQSSRLAHPITVEFKHVHNSYIATLLRFGLLGLLLGFAILIFPIIDLFKSTKGKEHIQHMKYLAIMFLVYWLVVNAFESFWYMKAGLWTYTVFMAAIYTIPLSQRYEKYQASLKS
ncbi:O-antigen ligase family protein [Vibrio sp. SCSIO 43132]|uniref:O-antigen ligase family protein n=1 Tax=Vibrio sp. SCSIO 43132 TaxID=2779363 RepID=UPI001CA7CE13|nr:O-antigen ligase family protein [Vibrio sp. SCSIO 43132]UAB70519.1 O-antigen ligase family protein [Vibrio sp. SCSIO 43132]